MTKISADNISLTTSCRSVHIDIIKGWAMLTIIIFHCDQSFLSGNLSQILGNSWNVPVFFIVAGFFLKEEMLMHPVNFIKGKIKRLYVPATIIYVWAVLLHNVFVYIGWYPLGRAHPSTGELFHFYDLSETCIRLAKVLVACSSGELIMGAMWFLYSLLYAFICMAILYWFVQLIAKTEYRRFWLMTVGVTLLACVSCVLSQKYDITISRVSTSLTAMALIWWGMIINKKWKWMYDNPLGMLVALMIFIHCIIMQKGLMVLAHNCYQDLIQLTIGSTAFIYFGGFVAKKIEKGFVGKFLAMMGRDSLYLMAFHIVGLFICNSLLEYLGVFSSSHPQKGLYTYQLGDNYLLLLLYTVSGVSVSFALIYVWRKLAKMTLWK